MNRIIIVIVVYFLTGCDRLQEVHKDDAFAKRFLGKTYCTTRPLFIWQWKEGDTSFFDYSEFGINRPHRNETDIEEHIELSTRHSSYTPIAYPLPTGSKVTIERIYYTRTFCCAGYMPLATINGTLFYGKWVTLTGMFNPPRPIFTAAETAVIDPEYFQPCD